MTDKLIVKDEILIIASPVEVWEVLTAPKYVAVWDELPENYPSDKMTKGSQVIWELPDGHQVVTTIIKAVENNELVIDLYSSKWEKELKEGSITYSYRLEELPDQTLLKIEIGDFAMLENGQDYYDASIDFAKEAKTTIKELAENM